MSLYNKLVPICRLYMEPWHTNSVRAYIRTQELHLNTSTFMPIHIIYLIQIMIHAAQIPTMILSILCNKSENNNKPIKPLHHMTMFLQSQSSWDHEWIYWISKDEFLKYLIFKVLNCDNFINIKSTLWLLGALENNNTNQRESVLIQYNIHQILKKLIKKWTGFNAIICNIIFIIAQIINNKHDINTRNKILNDYKPKEECILHDIWTELCYEQTQKTVRSKLSLNTLNNTALMICNICHDINNITINITQQKIIMNYFKLISSQMDNNNKITNNTLYYIFECINRICKNHSYMINVLVQDLIINLILKGMNCKLQNLRLIALNSLNHILNQLYGQEFLFNNFVKLGLLKIIKSTFFACDTIPFQPETLLTLLSNILLHDNDKINSLKKDDQLLNITAYGIFSSNKQILTLTTKFIEDLNMLRNHLMLCLQKLQIIEIQNEKMIININTLQQHGFAKKEIRIINYLLPISNTITPNDFDFSSDDDENENMINVFHSLEMFRKN